MDASDPTAEQAATPAPAAADASSLAAFGRHALEFARAWGDLVAGEAALARANAVLLIVGALVVPALAFATLVAVDAVLAAIAYDLARDWIIATSAVLLIDVALLIALLVLLRNWWRSLALPQSRAALKRLWRNPDEREDEGSAGADARRAA